MSNTYFEFKQFRIEQSETAMKVTTDGCMLGAWAAEQIISNQLGKPGSRILDIGAGTGLLSLMLAQQLPGSGHAGIQAIEIDPAAHAQAKSNIQGSPWKEIIAVKKGDVRKLKDAAGFDLIISNPPYYEKSLKGPKSAKNVAHHDEGLLLEELFEAIGRLLKENGHFFLILPESRRPAINDGLFLQDLQLKAETRVSSSEEKKPFRLLLHGVKTKAPVATEVHQVSIRNQEEEYTGWFKSLLQPYYLAF